MRPVRTGTGHRIRPGDVIKNTLDNRWVIIAGWDPRTTLISAWTDPDEMGLLDKALTHTPNSLGLEWAETQPKEQS